MASSFLKLFPDHLVLCVSALQWNNAILGTVFFFIFYFFYFCHVHEQRQSHQFSAQALRHGHTINYDSETQTEINFFQRNCCDQWIYSWRWGKCVTCFGIGMNLGELWFPSVGHLKTVLTGLTFHGKGNCKVQNGWTYYGTCVPTEIFSLYPQSCSQQYISASTSQSFQQQLCLENVEKNCAVPLSVG